MTVKISVLFEGDAKKTALSSPAAHIFCPGKARQALKGNAKVAYHAHVITLAWEVTDALQAVEYSTVTTQPSVDVPSERDTFYGIVAPLNKIGNHRFMPLPQPFDKPVSSVETKSSVLFSYADAWPTVDSKPV